MSDASFAQEVVVEANGDETPHRDQTVYMVLLVDPAITTLDVAGCHVWCWRSLADKRVCRATLQGEAHGILSGAEMGDRLRAIVGMAAGER